MLRVTHGLKKRTAFFFFAGKMGDSPVGDAVTPVDSTAAAVIDVSTECCSACARLLVASASRSLCSGCRSALYCDTACQRADWARHHEVCEAATRLVVAASAGTPLTQEQRDFQAVLASVIVAAQTPVELYELGRRFASGDGVALDPAAAYVCFQRCAALADPPCEVWAALGESLQHGLGVAPDGVEAVRLYRIGAAADDRCALFKLGQCLLLGLGTEPDAAAGVALLSSAVARGCVEALPQLAFAFQTGRGIRADTAHAVALYDTFLASVRTRTHDNPLPVLVGEALCNLGLILSDNMGSVPRYLRRGRRLLHCAAVGGYEPARLALARLRGNTAVLD